MPWSTNAKIGKIQYSAVIIVMAVLAAAVLIIRSQSAAAEALVPTDYSDSSGQQYSFLFYDGFSTNTLTSGSKQLVSKVSRDSKFPLIISAVTADAAQYEQLRNCGSFTTVATVTNEFLNQPVSICDIVIGTSKDARDTVYVAGFLYKDQSHVVTISQDLSKVDRSSADGLKAAAQKLGMQPYRQDIERIIASIRLQ